MTDKRELLKRRAEAYVKRAQNHKNEEKHIFRIDDRDKVTRDDPQVQRILEVIEK